MTTDLNTITFRPNTRKLHADRFENICRENGWVRKNEQVIRPNTSAYVILLKSELIGYFAIDINELGEHCFWGFYILPQYRNKGYGSMVIQKVALTEGIKGIPMLFCHAHKDNAVALKLYQRYAFVLGKDNRLYENLQTCNNCVINDMGEYTFVFLQRVWGHAGYTMKNALEEKLKSEFQKIVYKKR